MAFCGCRLRRGVRSSSTAAGSRSLAGLRRRSRPAAKAVSNPRSGRSRPGSTSPTWPTAEQRLVSTGTRGETGTVLHQKGAPRLCRTASAARSITPGQEHPHVFGLHCNAQVLSLNCLGAQSHWAHHWTAKGPQSGPGPKFVMKETPSVGLGPGAVATSSELGTRLDLLKDGQPAAAREDVGGSWIGPARSGVWAEFRWPEAMKITSVQIYGTDGVGSRTKSGLLVLGFGPVR